MSEGQSNQGHPGGQPQRPMPQGRRPRPGAPRPNGGAPRPIGEDGQPVGPQKSGGGDGKTWAIAIVLTVLLVGGSIALLMKQSADQGEADAKAQLPAAFQHVMVGNFEDKFVVDSKMLEGVSDEDKAVIKAGASAAYNFDFQSKLPKPKTITSESDALSAKFGRNKMARKKFFADAFPLMDELHALVLDASLKSDEESNEDYVIEVFQALNVVRVYIHAFDNLPISDEPAMVNGYRQMIRSEFDAYLQDLSRAQKDATQDAAYTTLYQDLRAGKGDPKHTKPFIFAYQADLMIKNGVYSFAKIAGAKDFDKEDREKAQKALKDKHGVGNKDFDGLVSSLEKKLHDQVAALDSKFEAKIKNDVAENQAARKAALDLAIEEIRTYIAKKEAAAAVLNKLLQKFELGGKDSVIALISKRDKAVKAAKDRLRLAQEEAAK